MVLAQVSGHSQQLPLLGHLLQAVDSATVEPHTPSLPPGPSRFGRQATPRSRRALRLGRRCGLPSRPASPLSSTSPVCTPARIAIPTSESEERSAVAHCSPRAGGVKRCQHAVAGSLHQASAAKQTVLWEILSWRSSTCLQALSPAAAAREVESTMSVNRERAPSRSASSGTYADEDRGALRATAHSGLPFLVAAVASTNRSGPRSAVPWRAGFLGAISSTSARSPACCEAPCSQPPCWPSRPFMPKLDSATVQLHHNRLIDGDVSVLVLLLDRDVGHESAGCGAVPMILAGLEEHSLRGG